MKAFQINDSASGVRLSECNAPQPQPGPGELLVRVCAAGVTPSELVWYPTSHDRSGGKRTHAIPGHEFSGVVAALGEGAVGFHIGQEVYGMNDWFSNGATAEYCITTPSSVAPKPERLTHAEAASVPIGALTAWQGLFDRAKVQSGERVLVHGGSGGVGLFAVQLARHRGARVIATASAANLDFVAGLGAEKVLDYRTTRFEEVAQGVDVVFDTVGGDTLQRSWTVLGPGGRLITVAAAGENETDDKTKQAFFIVEPSQKQLTEVGDLLDRQQIRCFVDAIVPFTLADSAYTGLVSNRGGRGKLVIALTDDAG